MNEIWECPIPDPYSEFSGQSSLMLLSQCVLGEAEIGSPESKLAVAWVVMNRVEGDYWPSTVHKVILQPKEFACFSDVTRTDAMLEPDKYSTAELWEECFQASVAAFYGYEEDPTHGACHYHQDSETPHWAKGKTPTVKIDKYLFYK